MAAVRRLAATVLVATVLVATVLAGATACMNTDGPVTPVPPSPSPATVETEPSTVVSATTGPASGSFPASARSYAEAVLTAWHGQQFTRIAELTTPTAQTQLQTTRSLDSAWTFASCQGAAGSSYCQFVNGDGDAATLRVDNQLLARAHAATEVKLDITTYSNNAVEYVKAFIEGWRTGNDRRMEVLASPAEADYVNRSAPPSSYSTCATLAGGQANIRVFNGAGLNYTVTVSVVSLGRPHAITGHAGTAAACS